MKKFLLAAAFVTVCSFSSALAQSAVQTEKAAVVNDADQTEVKEKPAAKAASSCCSKNSKEAKACSDKKEAKSAAGKSSCCQKGHTDAKAEEKVNDHAGHKH